MRYTFSLLAGVGVVLAPTMSGAQASPPQLPVITRQSAVQAMRPGEAPTNFVASLSGPRGVRLSWSAPASAAGYMVFRATTPAGPWTALTQAPISTLAYDDQSVAPKSRYEYRVVARYADKLEATTASASVVTPCDKYCPNGECLPKPATQLKIVEGAVGTGAQRRLTIMVTAIDAATGAALNGTVTLEGMTSPTGKLISYSPCRAGRSGDGLAEIVPCRGRVTIPGRGSLKLVTQG